MVIPWSLAVAASQPDGHGTTPAKVWYGKRAPRCGVRIDTGTQRSFESGVLAGPLGVERTSRFPVGASDDPALHGHRRPGRRRRVVAAGAPATRTATGNVANEHSGRQDVSLVDV